MATAKPTGALVALDDSEREPIELYKKSQAELLRALESRQNQLFDPTLLAMAQGFLAPTKYGTFGESLGNVAGTVGAAREAETKRAQEMAMLRMELAKQQLEQSRIEGAAKLEADFRAGKWPPQAGGAAQPSGQPAAEGDNGSNLQAARDMLKKNQKELFGKRSH